MKTYDTTPVLGNFSTTDPESDDVEYQIQWDEDYNFGSPVTKSSSGYPDDGGWTAATFSSGASTAYTVQSGDALTSGQTYWWRVRARDPTGSNLWSSYSAKRSLTVDTSIGLSQWFQTTNEQFDTGNLTGVETSNGSVQVIAGAIAKVGTDTSGTGNSLSLSFSHTLVAGTNRIVIVSIGIENGSTVDVSSVTYGGVAMTKAIDGITGTFGFRYLCEIWYILEASLPSAGSKTVVITGSGIASTPEINALCAEYTGVNQSVPEATAEYHQTTGTTITNTISPSNNAWVISAVGSGNAGSFTHAETQVEILDFADASSQFAVAELRGANGQTSLSSTFSGTVNRLERIAASFTAASGGSGTIVSGPIDYDWVSGATSWGRLSWTDDETTGDIKYQVLYWDGDSWELIPDSALSGNSTGFDDSPASLSGLDTTTYNQLKIKATLSDVGGTPYLKDWTISWISWESYHTDYPPGGTQCDNFTGDYQTVYMHGEGFEVGHSYHIGYYDGNGNKVVSNGAGTLTDSTLTCEWYFPNNTGSAAGDWHAVVYDDAIASPPATYVADDPNAVVEDWFYVQAEAIPEFPAVLTAIVVTGLCFGIYYWMRRKLAYVKA